jgi:acyl-CoA hydrolase
VRLISESKLGAVLGGLPGAPRVVMSGNFATPWRALSTPDAAAAEYRLFMLNAQQGIPDRDGVVLESAFVGSGMRRSERLRYFPCRLSLVPNLLSETLPPDVVLLHTSMPVNGTVSLGIEVNILPAAIEAALARGGLVIAQVNPRMPYTQGDAVLPEDYIDYAIEEDAPLPSPQSRPASEVFGSIGERVAALIPDGATLQLGIGGVPDAVLAALTGRRGLTVWSEMFSDGVLALDRTGRLTRANRSPRRSCSAAQSCTTG